jgi:two-component system phosphate regulon sensor histidine kinase PhoR
VRKVLFYDIQIGNPGENNSDGITVKTILQVQAQKHGIAGVKDMSSVNDDDFKQMALKLNTFISVADTSRLPTQDEIFKTFYNVNPDKISYLNIPRREDIRIYRALLRNKQAMALASKI